MKQRMFLICLNKTCRSFLCLASYLCHSVLCLLIMLGEEKCFFVLEISTVVITSKTKPEWKKLDCV